MCSEGGVFRTELIPGSAKTEAGAKDQGVLIIVSGPSGVGKGTVVSRYLAMDKNSVRSISATTRQPRPGEVEGKDYFFVTEAQFHQRIEHNELVEWNQHFSAYYGTPRDFIEAQLALGKRVILEIDVNGGLAVMKDYPQCLTIFVAPPSFKVLEQRLRDRHTETEEQLAGRLLRVRMEMKSMQHYSYTIVNDQLDDAVTSFASIVRAELCRTSRIKYDDSAAQ